MNKPVTKMNVGITIIEIMIAIFIMTAIGVVAGRFLGDIFSLSHRLEGGADTQQAVSDIFKKITVEIRDISQANGGAYALAEVNPNSFTFYSDTDKNGVKEKIRYFLDGANLKRGSIVPTGTPPTTYNPASEIVTVAASNIVNGSTPVFQYYDSDYSSVEKTSDKTPMAGPQGNITDVRLVTITLIIDKDASSPSPPLTMTTQVAIRNLKSNL